MENVLAKTFDYYNFITNSHELYSKYYNDWQLALRSFYGGIEYRDGQYLKYYSSDATTPAEVINTYDVDETGATTNVYSTEVVRSNSSESANDGTQYASNFYYEKLQNVPVFPYTRLYTSEFNAILFRVPPQRTLPDTEEVNAFLNNADGDENSLNEFMSMVDTYTTLCGVVWISCVKPAGAQYPKWRMHKPTDVTNWSYSYTASGDLELNRIAIRIAQDSDVEIFQYFTKDTIETIFMPVHEDAEIDIPEDAEFIPGTQEDDKGFYRIIQPNELGYIPVRPVYQSTPIYRGIGHTPIFDIAQIQRSVYSDMGEVYQAVSYSIHPVNVIDETTLAKNGGTVSAEPGSVIITEAGVSGSPNYTFEFVGPDLGSLDRLQSLIDQKIEKMNQVAMIRSEELIKASRSGVQIEHYDSKLEAFIRKKATALENAEYNLWKIWFDWQDMPMPEDLAISYNRLYSQKGVENEIKEMNMLLDAYERYENVFVGDAEEFTVRDYETEAEAEAEANKLGGTGTHSHTREDGLVTYMPFATHEEYELRLEMITGVNQEETPKLKEQLKDKLMKRLDQLIESTYSNNSL